MTCSSCARTKASLAASVSTMLWSRRLTEKDETVREPYCKLRPRNHEPRQVVTTPSMKTAASPFKPLSSTAGESSTSGWLQAPYLIAHRALVPSVRGERTPDKPMDASMFSLAMLLSFVRTMLTQSEARRNVNNLKRPLVLGKTHAMRAAGKIASFATCPCPRGVYERD